MAIGPVDTTGLAIIGLRSEKQQAQVTAKVVTQALEATKQIAQQAASSSSGSSSVDISV